MVNKPAPNDDIDIDDDLIGGDLDEVSDSEVNDLKAEANDLTAMACGKCYYCTCYIPKLCYKYA